MKQTKKKEGKGAGQFEENVRWFLGLISCRTVL